MLGVDVADDGDDWVVTPAPLAGGGTVDVGLAGTVQRFVPPLAALAAGPVRFDGDPRARERPLAPLLAGLRALGATVDDGGRGGLPLTVHGAGHLAGGDAAIDASASSQFVSGLLLAAPRYDAGHPAAAHRRRAGAERAAGRHDRPHAPVRRRRGRVRPGRVASGPSSRDGCAAASWRWRRTCPARRRSSPPRWRPAAGCACRAGRAARCSRATGCRSC